MSKDKGIFFIPVGGIYDRVIITMSADEYYADMYLDDGAEYTEYKDQSFIDLKVQTKVAGEGLERW